MQLKIQVSMWGENELDGVRTITSFDDIDKLGRDVATAVRHWARQIPVRKSGSRTQLDLRATWAERDTRSRKEKE